MSFRNRLSGYGVAGIIIWYAGCVGTGLYLRPFMFVCGWPVLLLHGLLPAKFPADLYQIAWTQLCLTSLISWLGVALLVAVVHHFVFGRGRDDVGNEVNEK